MHLLSLIAFDSLPKNENVYIYILGLRKKDTQELICTYRGGLIVPEKSKVNVPLFGIGENCLAEI